MEYVSFGRSGLKVSRLAFGLGFRGQSDATIAERTIERAVELGINFIDCANVYGLEDDRAHIGTSEQILARVLKRHRDDLVISSKVCSRIGPGPNDAGLSRYHIMREIDRTLARLDTDHVDVYILHSWDATTPLDETLRAMDDVVRAGKTRYVGVSNFQAWQVLKAQWIQDQLGLAPLICIQNPYNLLNRELEQEMWPAQRDQHFGVMTYSPLGVGLLSGAYTPGSQAPAGSLYATVRAERFAADMNEKARAILDALQEIAAAHEKTVAQTAINWVLSHPEVTMAITGGDTTVHMEENVGAVGWTITEEERGRLDAVSEGAQRTLD
ncbi:MAG: aldo/keto reductase [Candidatus Latescibacterota bacterium]|jgi:aryl-alcohol dehydrogenase-like predicted oxidoreductase